MMLFELYVYLVDRFVYDFEIFTLPNRTKFVIVIQLLNTIKRITIQRNIIKIIIHYIFTYYDFKPNRNN